MQTTSKELTISWQKANDPTPVTYKLSIFDETCSSEIYSKEIKDALNHTVAANVLSAATTYCLKIEARDLAQNKRNATNNSIKFVTAYRSLCGSWARSHCYNRRKHQWRK